MAEPRAHKIRGKPHKNKLPTQNIMILMEAVEMIQKSSTSGVQQKMKEVTTSWTMTPISLTTAPASRASDA